jgi:hypothetical protein
MTADLPPLEPEVRALLDEVEGPPPMIPGSLQAKMRGRIELALAAETATGGATPRRSMRLRQATMLGAAALVGAGVTHFVERMVAAPRVEVVRVVVDAGPPPTASVHADAVPAESASPEPARTASPSASAPRPVAHDTDLALEGRLIDTARAALAHGDFEASLAAVGRHAKAFPGGRLAEEREAIAVQALAGAGRTAEARARAQTFRKNYPQSLFVPLVDAAVGPNP